MPTSTILTNFTAGELSPLLDGRVDLAKYYNGVKTLENFVVLSYGGVVKIPGTYFIAEVKDSSKLVRLIPFKYSTIQSYIIEVGDQYMRFYKSTGQIYSGSNPYEISTPYLEDDIFDLQFAQDADVMYIVHPNYKPRKLTRSSDTSWTLTEYTPTSDPFVHNAWQASHAYNLDDYVIPTVPNGYYYRCIAAGTSGGSQPTWPTTIGQTVNDGGVTWRCESDEPVNFPSCVGFFEDRIFFASTRAKPQTVWGSKSGDFEDMTQGSNDDDALEYTIYSEQVNSIQWVIGGKILILGTIGGCFSLSSSSSTEPLTPTNVVVKRETTIGSVAVIPKKIGNFVYFVQRNGKTLREFSYNFDIDEYIAKDLSILSEHILKEGIVEMDYQQSPHNILWIVKENGEIATLTRQIEHDVVGWSRHTTDGYYESVAVISQEWGDDQVWFVVRREIDGTTKRYVEVLMPFEYEEQEDCFYVHSGLSLDNPKEITDISNTNPIVITCPSHGFSDGDEVIIRGVSGMTEINNRKFIVANSTTNTFELDGEDGTEYGEYEGGGEARKCVSSVSGLNHLEGKEVSILVDGAVHPNKVVSSGVVNLDWSGGEIHIGLPYTATLQTMRLEAGQREGTAQGKFKKVHKVVARFYKSLGGVVGTADKQDEILFRTTSDRMDVAIPLYTGDKEIIIPSRVDKDAFIYIKQESPLPMNLICLVLFLSVYEG